MKHQKVEAEAWLTVSNKSKVAAHCLGHLTKHSMLGMVMSKPVDNLLGLVNVLFQFRVAFGALLLEQTS